MRLTHIDGDREMNLHEDNLHDLIEKLKSWNDWDENIELLRKTKRFKKDPVGEERCERESGWYWFNDNKEITK